MLPRLPRDYDDRQTRTPEADDEDRRRRRPERDPHLDREDSYYRDEEPPAATAG